MYGVKPPQTVKKSYASPEKLYHGQRTFRCQSCPRVPIPFHWTFGSQPVPEPTATPQSTLPPPKLCDGLRTLSHLTFPKAPVPLFLAPAQLPPKRKGLGVGVQAFAFTKAKATLLSKIWHYGELWGIMGNITTYMNTFFLDRSKKKM